MLKKLLTALGILVVFLGWGIAGVVGKHFGNAVFSSSKPDPREVEQALIDGLTKAAEQNNRQGAVMVDQHTRWDHSVVGPGARLTYFYSFPRHSSRDINQGDLVAHLKTAVTKGVCASKEMNLSLQHGATYVYAYRSNDNVEVGRFELNKNDCNRPTTEVGRLPELDCQETGEPAVVINGQRLKPVKCK